MRRVIGLGVAAMVGVATATHAAIHNYVLTLDGLQETPPNASPATGSGTATIDDVANTLTLHVEFSGLTAPETASHIHGMAPPGTAAGVLFALPLGSPKDAVWNYMESQEPDILAGLTYVNIHTSTFPGGEIRGQIVPVPEPATWSLMAAAAGLGLRLRRQPAAR